MFKITKKNKKELGPVIEEKKINNLDQNEFKNLARMIAQKTVIKDAGGEEIDSFFREIVKNLMSKDDITLKTEYISITENFAGTKLEALAEDGDMPYLSSFLNKFESKRVSLDRKGRKELVMSLEKREEEQRSLEQARLRPLLGF